MASTFFLASLASRTKNQKVMWLISEKFPKLRDNLATNKNLPSDLWLKLLKKSPVGLASNLVTYRNFNRVELREALKDKRKTVKVYLFRKGFNPEFVKEAREILKASWFTTEHAELWVRSGTVNPKLLKEVLKKTSEPYLVNSLKDENLFDAKEVVEIISSLKLNYSSILELAKLIEARPQIVSLLIPISRGSLHGALAGSRTLFDQKVWAKFIAVLESDIKTTFAKDAIWMALANPNLDLENSKKVVALAETLPRSVYQYKLLNVKQDALLNSKRVAIASSTFHFAEKDWLTITEGPVKLLVETAVKILNPMRYPIYYKESYKDSLYSRPPFAVNPSTHKSEEVTLDFIPNKDRVTYTEELEELVSKRVTTPEQWETLLGLIIDWDQSFDKLISTTVELSK